MQLAQFPAKWAWLLLLYPPCLKCAVVVFFSSSQYLTLGASFALFLPWALVIVFMGFVIFRAPTQAYYIDKRGLEDEQRKRAIVLHQLGRRPSRRRGLEWRPYGSSSRNDETGFEEIRMQPRAAGLYDDATTVASGRGGRHASEDPRFANDGFFSPGQQQDQSIVEDELHNYRPRQNLVVRFFTPRGAWRNNKGERLFVDIFGDFFADYRTYSFRAFLMLELFVASGCAILDGYGVATQQCEPLLICLVILLAIHFLAVTFWRPFDVQGNNVFFIALSLGQLVVACVALAASRETVIAPRTLKIIMILVMILQFGILFRAACDIFMVGARVCKKVTYDRKYKQFDRNSDEIDEEVLAAVDTYAYDIVSWDNHSDGEDDMFAEDVEMTEKGSKGKTTGSTRNSSSGSDDRDERGTTASGESNKGGAQVDPNTTAVNIPQGKKATGRKAALDDDDLDGLELMDFVPETAAASLLVPMAQHDAPRRPQDPYSHLRNQPSSPTAPQFGDHFLAPKPLSALPPPRRQATKLDGMLATAAQPPQQPPPIPLTERRGMANVAQFFGGDDDEESIGGEHRFQPDPLATAQSHRNVSDWFTGGLPSAQEDYEELVLSGGAAPRPPTVPPPERKDDDDWAHLL